MIAQSVPPDDVIPLLAKRVEGIFKHDEVGAGATEHPLIGGVGRVDVIAGSQKLVVEVEAGATIRVVRAVAAVDCGRTINPDGVRNQVEGGIVQAVSWVLKEQVRFDRTRITTRTWDDYPILRFSEAPSVEVSIIDRPDEPSLGVGEAVAGPVAAAIANAVFDAIGVRVRDLPLTRERMLAAINEA